MSTESIRKMSWSPKLQELKSRFSRDFPKDRILCAHEVITHLLNSEFSGEEAIYFLESELEICPVTMICVYKKWNVFKGKIDSDPEWLFRLLHD
jgi:hypothetical protein